MSLSSEKPPLAVLLVDDEKNIRTTLRTFLETMDAHVVKAQSVERRAPPVSAGRSTSRSSISDLARRAVSR